jgi:hypothetical protein
MQFSGAPAFNAAARRSFAVSTQHFCAYFGKAKIIGFLVLREINDLKMIAAGIDILARNGAKALATNYS